MSSEELGIFAGRLWTLVENGPVAIILKDRSGKYYFGNSIFERIVATSAWEGKEDDDLFPPEKAKRLSETAQESLATGHSQAVVVPCITEERGCQWWKVIYFPVNCPDGETMVGGMAVDVTDQRRVEEEVVDISDREQKRMGRELHDGLCQHLVGLCMMSQSLLNGLETEGSRYVEKARAINSFLQGGVDVARELIRNYHLVAIEEKGLIRALKEFVVSTGQLFDTPVKLRVNESLSIPRKSVAVQLFRITQEAVHNALKHGSPTRVEVVIDTHDNDLVVEIRDDGQGFPAGDDSHRGIGLNTMTYRAEVIGGQLTIEDRSDSGVVVRCMVPLEYLAKSPQT